MTKAGFANSEGWIEIGPRYNQREAPFSSMPMKRVATTKAKTEKKNRGLQRNQKERGTLQVKKKTPRPSTIPKSWRKTK